MASIIEWKDQQRTSQSFIFAVPSKFQISTNSKECIITYPKAEIKSRVVFADPATANPRIRNEAEIAGSIVIICRGGNTFASKYANAISLGASLIIIANLNDSFPNEIFSCFGDLTSTGIDMNAIGDNFPPCIMISSSAFKRLKLDTPFMLTVSPMQQTHLSRLQSYDLGPALRANIMLGMDNTVKDIIREAILREVTENRNSFRYQVLNDVEHLRDACGLHIAAECQQLSCLSLLLRLGANTECEKCDGYTPLHLACMKNDSESVALLVASSAYLEHPHPTGWTALHLASKYNAIDAIQVLIEAGIDINMQANDGSTALHVACILGNENAVTALVRAGADTSLETLDGLNASTAALYSGYPNCAALMEKHTKITKIRRKSEKQKSNKSLLEDSVLQPQESTKADDLFSSYSDNSSNMSAKASSIEGQVAADGHVQYDQVFGTVVDNNDKAGTINASRRELSRRPSTRTLIQTNTKYGLGSKWKTTLDKLCDYCNIEAVSKLNSRSCELTDVNIINHDDMLPADEEHSRLAEMIEADLSRCCFINYRQGPKRQLLKRLVLKVLYGEVKFVDDPNIDMQSSIFAARQAVQLLASKGLSYKQGLLSLLAPIVDVWFGFECDTKSEASTSTLTSNNSGKSVNSYVITPEDDSILNQCAESFYSLLFCFPCLSKYLQRHGTVDVFQHIFDTVMRILCFWFPSIANTLAWRSFSPALFAVPWVTTLMADVLSLSDVQYLWSRLLEILEARIEPNSSTEDCVDSNSNATAMHFGDQILSAIVVAAVLQISVKIDPIHNRGSSATINPKCALLPSQEELLMLFSSINNNAFHESLFENKLSSSSGSQDENIVQSPVIAATSKAMDIGEIARCIDWLLINTPSELFRDAPAAVVADHWKEISPSKIQSKSGASKHASGPTSSSSSISVAVLSNDVHVGTVWEVLGDVPVLTSEDIQSQVHQHNLSVLILDVSGSAEAGSQFVPEGGNSIIDVEVVSTDATQPQRRRSSVHNAGPKSMELVGLLQNQLDQRMQTILADESLMENLIEETIQNASSKALPLPIVVHRLCQELKIDGMIRYYRTLAHNLSQNHNRIATPPLQHPSPPVSLRQYAPRSRNWRDISGLAVAASDSVAASQPSSSNSMIDMDTDTSSSGGKKSLCDLMIVLCASTSDVHVKYIRDIAATLVTCGFNRVVMLK